MSDDHIEKLANAICGGERRALARGITLVESTRADHQDDADRLIEALHDRTGDSVRLGISGPPGVGKSTFIEAFGLHVIGAGHRVAVLAVDPSSTQGGGAILGDKTRMEELSRHPDAFIRPSPSAGAAGGAAPRTREAVLLCEAAGHDVVIVETVGVGQSETAVRDMVDMFILLLQPGGGDELQGLKRGIMEIADLMVVTKADGSLEKVATETQAAYQGALGLLRPRTADWAPKVLKVSAQTGRGIDAVWRAAGEFRAATQASGGFAAQRADQAVAWLWAAVTGGIEARLRRHPGIAERLPALEAGVADGSVSPRRAARELIGAFLGPDTSPPT